MTAKEILENYCSKLRFNTSKGTIYYYIDVDELSFDRYISFKENLRNNFLKIIENTDFDIEDYSFEKYKRIVRNLPFSYMVLWLVFASPKDFENVRDTNMILDRIDNYSDFDSFYLEEYSFSLHLPHYLLLKKENCLQYCDDLHYGCLNIFLYLNLYLEYLLNYSIDDMCIENKDFIFETLYDTASFEDPFKIKDNEKCLKIEREIKDNFISKQGINLGLLILSNLFKYLSRDEVEDIYLNCLYRSRKFQKYPNDYDFDEEVLRFNKFIDDNYNSSNLVNLKWNYELLIHEPETFMTEEIIDRILSDYHY